MDGGCNFLSSDAWEIVWLVSLIMNYKNSVDGDDRDRTIDHNFESLSGRLDRIESKLDLLLERY